ncbi:MAG: hypothetical protein GWN86_15660 [Desulfobacterales bacterium]|nr:hypothetical protein [Desulfobacterales bacterium]
MATRLIVISCSRYQAAWKPFHTLLHKFVQYPNHWKNGLITDGEAFMDLDKLRYACPFEDLYATVGDNGWCRNFHFALDKMDPNDLILLFQEDFFITAPVPSHVLHLVEQFMLDNPRVGCFRLYPCPGPKYPAVHGLVAGLPFGEVHPGEDYRISCQVAMWRVSYLKKIVPTIGNAMHFELAGTDLSLMYPEKVLSLLRPQHNQWPLQYICSGISKGRWNPDALKLFEEHGIPKPEPIGVL